MYSCAVAPNITDRNSIMVAIVLILSKKNYGAPIVFLARGAPSVWLKYIFISQFSTHFAAHLGTTTASCRKDILAVVDGLESGILFAT